jgi:DNA-binding transcriptional MerR regulator
MEYTKADIANILKKKKRTIQYWTDFGLVIPDVSPSQGRGKARVYSDRNLVEFAMIDYLSRLHIELASVKAIMAGLRKGYDEIKGDNGEVQKITFSDFFRNREWGDTKELAFVEVWYPVKSLEAKAQALLADREFQLIFIFRIMQVTAQEEAGSIGVEGFFNSYRSKSDLFQRFLWLGEIKRRAVMDLLGMESLLAIEHG